MQPTKVASEIADSQKDIRAEALFFHSSRAALYADGAAGMARKIQNTGT